MATFSANIETATRSSAVASDSKTPRIGLLNLSSIASPTALSGTTGIDCSLIPGDEWNQLEGNLTENTLKNHTGTVFLNETYTVKGNLVHRVNGTTNDTRVGVHNQTNIAARNDTFMHTRAEVHHQPEHREQKTEDNEKTEKHIEVKQEHTAFNWYMLDGFGIRSEYNLTMNFEKKMLNASANIFNLESEGAKVQVGNIKAELKGLRADVHAGKLKASVSHLKAIGANINAGIAANLDSPFG